MEEPKERNKILSNKQKAQQALKKRAKKRNRRVEHKLRKEKDDDDEFLFEDENLKDLSDVSEEEEEKVPVMSQSEIDERVDVLWKFIKGKCSTKLWKLQINFI